MLPSVATVNTVLLTLVQLSLFLKVKNPASPSMSMEIMRKSTVCSFMKVESARLPRPRPASAMVNCQQNAKMKAVYIKRPEDYNIMLTASLAGFGTTR